MPRPRHARPQRLYLLTGALQGFSSAWALAAVVWWVDELELSPIRLILLGTALELAVLLSEVPTGIVADLFSRKWSLVAAYGVTGLAQFLGPITEIYWLLLVWQVMWGIGWTLQSGADTAWVTDETGEPVEQLIVRHAVWRSLGLIVGLPFVAIVGFWSLVGAMHIVGLISVAFAVYLAVVMPETNFTPTPRTARSRFGDAIDVWRRGARVIRGNRLLLSVVLAMLLVGMASEAIDRLDVLRVTQFALPDVVEDNLVVFFGVIWWVMTIVNIPVMLRLERDLESAGVRRQSQLMAGLMLVGGIGTLGLALGPGVVVAMTGWLVRDVAAEVIDPLGVTIMNNHPDSSVRATVISFWGQAEASGEIVGGIVLGSLAELTTVPLALAVAAALYVLGALVVKTRGPGAETAPGPAAS